MKLLRRQFLQLALSAAATPALAPARHGANRLSGAAGVHYRRLCRRRRQRHSGAADRTTAVGRGSASLSSSKIGRAPAATWPPTRSCMPRRMATRCCSRAWRMPSTCRFIPTSISISPATWRRSRLRPQSDGHGGGPVVSGEDGSRIHRLRQGASGHDRHGLGRHRRFDPCRRRAVSDVDRHQIYPRALSRLGAGAGRSSRRPASGHVR